MNTFKTMVLLTLLTLLFVFIGRMLGGQSGMIIAFVFACVMNFVSYWFSDKIVLALYRAKEVTRAEAPELVGIVQNLAMRANIPMPRVYIIPQESPNAFATGRNPSHAAVAVTQGILRLLSREELSGVLAHEMSHVIHRDILISSVTATIAGAISMLTSIARWGLIFGDRRGREGANPFVVLIALILAPLAALLIQLAISRSREYDADKGGAQLWGRPRDLARALQKLTQVTARVPMAAEPATAHMFIVNPLSAKGLAVLFSTHPPLEERIKRLETMRMSATSE